MIRGAALLCKRNQQGADIIIPIYIGILNEIVNKQRTYIVHTDQSQKLVFQLKR